jgi:hypothetical protein
MNKPRDQMSWYGFLLAKYWSRIITAKAKLMMQDISGTIEMFILAYWLINYYPCSLQKKLTSTKFYAGRFRCNMLPLFGDVQQFAILLT